MPTLALMREAPEEEISALGDWQGKERSSMPIRYAEAAERQASAAITKIFQVELLKEAAISARPLSWEEMRKCLARMDIQSAKKKAGQMFCKDKLVDQTPEARLEGIVQPERRFNLSRLVFRAAKGKRSLKRKDQLVATEESVVLAGSSAKWCINAYNGREVLHIMDDQVEVPVCRRGLASRRSLACPVASGSSLEEFRSLAKFEGEVCKTCLARSEISIAEAFRRAAGLEIAQE